MPPLRPPIAARTITSRPSAALVLGMEQRDRGGGTTPSPRRADVSVTFKPGPIKSRSSSSSLRLGRKVVVAAADGVDDFEAAFVRNIPLETPLQQVNENNKQNNSKMTRMPSRPTTGGNPPFATRVPFIWGLQQQFFMKTSRRVHVHIGTITEKKCTHIVYDRSTCLGSLSSGEWLQ